MKRSMLVCLATLIMCQIAIAQEMRTFNLRSGDIITGQVVAETDDDYQVLTSFGTITILKSQIQPQLIELELKDGNLIKGELVEQTTAGVRLNTTFGEIFISADKITWMNTPGSDLAGEDGRRRPTTGANQEIWYFSDERLMDIWFDPTGFALRRGEFYFSGLSWAFGLTEKIQISSRWSSYYLGDFNVRPKLTLLETGDVQSKIAISVGGHLHTRGSPNKWEYADTARWDYSYNPSTGQETQTPQGEWVRVGSTLDKDGGRTNDSNKLWGELFAAVSVSNLNRGNKGRTNITAGASVIMFPNHDPLPRAYLGIDRDVRRNVKVMGEIFWDPYYAPIYQILRDEQVTFPLFFDIGFMTNSLTRNKKLWVGVHYQFPWLAFYFKF